MGGGLFVVKGWRVEWSDAGARRGAGWEKVVGGLEGSVEEEVQPQFFFA